MPKKIHTDANQIILNTLKYLRQKKDERFSSIPLNNVVKLFVDMTGTDIHSAFVINCDTKSGLKTNLSGFTRHVKRAYLGRPTGRRPVGRPKDRWIDMVEADLRELRATDWQEIAQDRERWRALVSEAKTHFGSLSQRSKLISVNVLDSKRLRFSCPKTTTYVIVALDEMKHRSGVQRNMRVPYYGENFLFDLYTTPMELCRKCLWFTVMEPCCNAGGIGMLGEAGVDLAHVWRQPHHKVTQKWVQLTVPNDPKCAAVGYLRVDISICVCAQIYNESIESRQLITNSLLLPNGSEQQPSCYQITIYRAYNVPCNSSYRPDFRGNPPTTQLRITFSNLVAMTSPQPRNCNPVYLERVSLIEMFPNVCDTVQLEVCSVAGGPPKVLASTRLRLSEISHGGENGFLPTFGPSFLHMYGPWRGESTEDGPYHRGAILLAMKTIVPDYKHYLRSVHVETVNIRSLDTEWIIENFVIYCPVFEVSMLDKSMFGTTCGVAITIGEIPFSGPYSRQELVDFEKFMLTTKQTKLHYTGGRCIRWDNHAWGHLELETCPFLQLAIRLPDFRYRMYTNNALIRIVTDLENDLKDVCASILKGEERPHDLLKTLHLIDNNVEAEIQRFLEIVRFSDINEDIQKHTTELDRMLVQLQTEKIEKIYYRLKGKKEIRAPSPSSKPTRNSSMCKKKILKMKLAECKSLLQDLKDLIYKTPDGWPYISLWLLSNGSRIAYAKIKPSEVLHSVVSEQGGLRCGKIQTFYLKPIKCSKEECNSGTQCQCISGKIELMAWMGAYRHRAIFLNSIPAGYRSATTGYGIECDPMSLECCVGIYRAKLVRSSDCVTAGMVSPFVRIHFMNHVKETQVCQNTLTPVWSEALRICCVASVPPRRLELFPPEILVEVCHCDAAQKKVDVIGRVTLAPLLVRSAVSKPSLCEWLDVCLGEENVGKIQISAQLKMNEADPNAVRTANTEEIIYKPGQAQAVGSAVFTSSVPEPLPQHMLPADESYKIDVYFWGLRGVCIRNKPLVTLELEDITIKSAIISHCHPQKTCCNFPLARVSQMFRGNLTNGSLIAINLLNTTTFGRMLFVGSNTKKPQNFQVTWIPKREREDTLALKPVVNPNFTQVNRKTFVRRGVNCPSFNKPKCFAKEDDTRKKKESQKIRWENVKSIFYVTKASKEEEILLLPMFTKARENLVVPKETEDDFWTRYRNSLHEKPCGDKEPAGNRITIYDSELERQPEFFKFKDWCSIIKMYSGQKTGIPDQDTNCQCGTVKMSIAIYRWPPPEHTVAVSNSGVDLNRGYFHNYPNNDPARYLVRVYAIKCTDLVPKGFANSSRCYVAVASAACNGKTLCDRESSVQRCAEPVFGKMYELDCTLPEDYLLNISVVDCGTSSDEVIGSTVIDLENRAYTKCRATVGLTAEYNMYGPNKWRDSERPSDILERLCERNHLPAPEYPDPSTLVFNGVEYKDLQSGSKYTCPLASKENLCLSILHKWHTMPVVGHRLVPEHVEVRTLYDPGNPSVEQGKIHMWVDMFPLDCRRAIPPPVPIRPHPDEHYELRVTVFGVRGVKVNKGSNIYVRAWIGPYNEAQDTDIYMTTNGEGYFNWRMIFQFQYRHTEKMLVFQDKCVCPEATELFPPILVVQVFDIDTLDPHDFLGTLTLDLSCMPWGARLPRSADAVTISCMRRMNMFAVRCTRGWWPLKMIDGNTGSNFFAGMIELEISLLTQDQALLRPIGMGRDPPAPLPNPSIISCLPLGQDGDDPAKCSYFDCSLLSRVLTIFGILLLGCCDKQSTAEDGKQSTNDCGPVRRLLLIVVFLLLGGCLYWAATSYGFIPVTW